MKAINNREQEQKFAQKAHIKNSEYDRQNTNATRYTNPVMRGSNPLPEDPAGIQRIFTNDLLRIIFSLAVGILFFFLATILGKMIFPYKFYSSLQYLLLSLLASAAICWCVSSLLKKAAAKGQKH